MVLHFDQVKVNFMTFMTSENLAFRYLINFLVLSTVRNGQTKCLMTTNFGSLHCCSVSQLRQDKNKDVLKSG